MVAREERDRLAILLRRLADGRITNDDYDSEFPIASDDRAVEIIAYNGWGLYSDFPTYRLRGKHALSPAAREHVARSILVLHSDLEYEWPREPRHNLISLIVVLLTVGWVDLRPWQEWKRQGDFPVWPFFRWADYEQALVKPRFLTGHHA